MKKIFLFCISLFFILNGQAQTEKVLLCKGPASYSYHSHICQGLRKCSTAYEKVTISEAKEIGRTPCGYCYKNTVSTEKISDNNNNNRSNPSQCAATTKKGTRCSRSAKPNGYCWQHG